MTGKAAFRYYFNGFIQTVEEANATDMALDVALPPQLTTARVQPQIPGGGNQGSALGVYAKIDAGRRDLAFEYLNFITQDKIVEAFVQEAKGSVATNKNAKPSDDPLAIKFGGFSDQITTYLDWYWPPEVTQAFQQNIQAGVGGQKTAEQAAAGIQAVFDGVVSRGYKFQD